MEISFVLNTEFPKPPSFFFTETRNTNSYPKQKHFVDNHCLKQHYIQQNSFTYEELYDIFEEDFKKSKWTQHSTFNPFDNFSKIPPHENYSVQVRFRKITNMCLEFIQVAALRLDHLMCQLPFPWTSLYAFVPQYKANQYTKKQIQDFVLKLRDHLYVENNLSRLLESINKLDNGAFIKKEILSLTRWTTGFKKFNNQQKK
jgi:hypothetical protein